MDLSESEKLLRVTDFRDFPLFQGFHIGENSQVYIKNIQEKLFCVFDRKKERIMIVKYAQCFLSNKILFPWKKNFPDPYSNWRRTLFPICALL
jgi:hypothetical protein